jgi:hypothetical protein
VGGNSGYSWSSDLQKQRWTGDDGATLLSLSGSGCGGCNAEVAGGGGGCKAKAAGRSAGSELAWLGLGLRWSGGVRGGEREVEE